MTVGQRIALKRKELGLSQEGLGERLGVSRQAIYKWESDAALPEIEKLVNLSREFSVSIDWLLGQGDEARELTPDQLRMVEEIVGRYLAARPGPEQDGGEKEQEEEAEPAPPKKRRRWPYVLAGAAAAAVLVGVLSNLFSRLDKLYNDTQNLQMNIGEIRYDVNSQIGSIASRVESILQSQNTLTAEQSAQIASTDYRANTVTVTAQAMPRTYVEGMTAEFILDSDGETVTIPGELGADHAFTAQLTGPLTDDISVSVAFLTGDQRETQLLEQFSYLYSGSFPDIDIHGGMSARKEEGGWMVTYDPVDVHVFDGSGGLIKLASLRLGLFRDQELAAWFTQEERPNFTGSMYTFHLDQEQILLENGHTYCLAAVAVDEYDREWVASEYWPQTVTEEDLESADIEYSRDPADWTY